MESASSSPSARSKESKRDLEDWTPNRSSVQALKQAKIVQSTVPVVEGMSYQEWLEQSGFANVDHVASSQKGSPNATQGIHESGSPAYLFARLQNETKIRKELETRLESLRQHYERDRSMLVEQAEAGHSALKESIRFDGSAGAGTLDTSLISQLRSQVASARELAALRTKEVQQLLSVSYYHHRLGHVFF